MRAVLPTLIAVAGAISADKYCYSAAAPNQPVALPDVPQDLELKMVQVLTRHGARTPLAVFPKHQPVWNCSENELSVFTLDGAGKEQVGRLFRLSYLQGRQALGGNCYMGQLTKLGAEQHNSIGQGFRDAFITKTGLLPPDWTAGKSAVKARSTEVPRVQQSAQSQLLALYPDHEQASTGVPVFDLEIVETIDDNMVSNSKLCPAITDMTRVHDQSDAWLSTFDAVRAEVGVLNAAFGVELGPTELLSYTDSFHVMDCMGVPYPTGVAPEDLPRLYDAVDKLWDLYYHDREMVVASMGQFLVDDFSSRFLPFVNKQSEGLPVFHLYSGHDTSVAPFLGLLGVYDGLWPPLASQVVVELLHSPTEDQHYIRIIYNGAAVAPPSCGVGSDGLPICTWAEWQALVVAVASELPSVLASCHARRPVPTPVEPARPSVAQQRMITLLLITSVALGLTTTSLAAIIFRMKKHQRYQTLNHMPAIM